MATSTPNLFTAIFLFLLPIASSDYYFQFTNFSQATKDIVYHGDAMPSLAGAVDFNSVFQTYKVGWVTYAKNIQLWDSETGTLSDFATNFSFKIDTLGSSLYGDGIAFFLAPVGSQIPNNSSGGFLGLFNTTDVNPKNPIVMVEFDPYHNNPWDPYKYGHIGINCNRIASDITTPWNASLYSGETCNASITYNAGTNNLSVIWSYGGNSTSQGNSSSLSHIIDLRGILPEWVMVGFSAAIGDYSEIHILESWAFSSSFNTTMARRRRHMKDHTLIVGLTVSMVVLILGAAIFIGSTIARKRSHVRRKQTEQTNLMSSINNAIERGAGPRIFSYADLVSATNNFSDERKLGQGGFGCVYRGYLNDTINTAVAVKKISRGSKQGEKEYIAEVKIISRLRHRNLVQLIGCCHDKGEFLLVYEFMPNGSLDAHLFGNKIPLTWAVRYRITLGLASALFYLHEEWEQCVVHRDIKSSNVMLDSDFNVKLGDFGLARLVDHKLGPRTTGLAETFGYMAPEYIRTGKPSKEADAYSFGVVVLEIASGRKSVNPREGQMEMGLVEWVWDLYGRGQILSAIDERLKSNFDAKEVECLMIVGLWCAYPDHSLRPSIRHAIQVLHFEAALPHLPTKMPVPTFHAPGAGCSRTTPEEPAIHSGEVIISSSNEMGR